MKPETKNWLGILAGLLAAFAFGFLAAALMAQASWGADPRYPDAHLTPGAIDPHVTVAQLCMAGYTADVRNVSEARKKQTCLKYDMAPTCSGRYEIDHFISLENGGLNDDSNLWPQIYCPKGNDPMKSGCWGAREKDKVETALHRWLCKGLITLEQDQAILKMDWVSCYRQLSVGQVCTPPGKLTKTDMARVAK